MIRVVEPRVKSTCLSCNERDAKRTFNIIVDQRVIVLCQECLDKLIVEGRSVMKESDDETT